MPLRDYQQAAFDATVAWFKYKKTPAIIVLGTGSGKSHVLIALAEHYASMQKAVLILTNRKELLEQTASKSQHPEWIGFYSAGIGEKRVDKIITLAGIQSIAKLENPPQWDVILVDECHSLGNDDESQYWQFLKPQLEGSNGYGAMLAGFTATPYRLKGGALGWGETIYDIGYAPLFKAGWLCPITNKIPEGCTPNLDDVPVKMGEFLMDRAAEIMEEPELLQKSVAAIVKYSRASNLIFVTSIAHGQLVQDALADNNIPASMVTSATPKIERENILNSFKRGEVSHLINCELLLIGFDAPIIDAIFCLRPTQSMGLWQQLMGRGVRLYPDKLNCLLVDMAGNLQRLGGIGTPYNGKAKREAKRKIGRICPSCEGWVEKVAATDCPDCGFIFPEAEASAVKHNHKPDTESATVFEEKEESYVVWDVSYSQHKSRKNGNLSLKVTFGCDYGKYGNISMWLSPKHSNDWVRHKAWQYFKDAGHELGSPIESYSWDDLLFHANQCRKPESIIVKHKKDFPEVVKIVYARALPAPAIQEDILDGDCIPF